MIAQPEIRPDQEIAERVGVLLFDRSAEVNTLMADAVTLLRARGIAVGGLVQHFGERLPSGKHSVWVDDIATGEVIRLDEPRGPGARSCTLDSSALTEAACRLRMATTSGAAVIVIPRFGSVEAEGGGLRLEIAEAVLSGAAVIIGVRPPLLPQLEQFLGGPGMRLPPTAASIAAWGAERAGRRAPAARTEPASA